ncbi:hypothetical protein J0S82_012438 [Galemys pyrenaicus]|uniref:Uncharacterized protein n=1 Tax=Galemys pyrenaicus TaxID=202257 RepID=A0A8J6DUI6_GALPY|nr:hypothetical protein J0S82_012438 [Galemys pyrenaicus]
MDDSNTSSQTQEHQTLTGLQLQKNELGRQNSKHASPGKPLIRHAEEDSFSSSYEFEGHCTPQDTDCPSRSARQTCLQERLPATRTRAAQAGSRRQGQEQATLSTCSQQTSTRHVSLLLSALKTHNSERRFYKRNLNRYSQEHWPYRRCLIGRP